MTDRTRGTVLVVDDDLELVRMLAVALMDGDYTYLLAVTPGEALQLAVEAHPDVILLDLKMPQMDGAEVSRRLRADPRTAAIPIIAMTAAPHLLRAGILVDDDLIKPFDVAELYAVVARWVQR